MDDNKILTYIDGLYRDRNLTNRQYARKTAIYNYGTVIDNDAARMLQVLILAAKPRHVLEIGTSIGFSTVTMARMMKPYGGKITTIEIDKKVAEQAAINFKREGVHEQIEIKIGDAFHIAAQLEQEFDLIFQDVGDKFLYEKMFDLYLSLLKSGGLLVADNTLFPVYDYFWGYGYYARMSKSLDAFNKKLAQSPYFESTILPIGSGLTVAVKK